MIWSDRTFHIHGPSVFTPYTRTQVRRTDDGTPIKSWGQSSAGYDIRASCRWRIPNPALDASHIVDLRDHKSVDAAYIRHDAADVVVPPRGVVFVESEERIDIPRDAFGIAIGKSTDARTAGNVYITPLEPGWNGFLVIELFNAGPFHRRFYAGEGIAQIVIFTLDDAPHTAYGDRPNAYQDQTGVAQARLV